jgi:hypothetical protein
MVHVRKHLTNSGLHAGLTPGEIDQMMEIARAECMYDSEAPSATLSLAASSNL